ncbi:TonB-dependent receptor [Gluconobacter thailandicus]|uniref:TonB-dependent receptor plug domain-containing protein n=1 Tax=Gluconobacter thailandicus TaxID=257438 RepID=A0AAP9JIU3_GLUTH|nr:TonB-dependent receptor plug domain-containing protein [Gluconobacter thailandicus]QEH97698.1 TonB-dependent receptor plug domain-containing protein [Gluconobacter thailandicus]
MPESDRRQQVHFRFIAGIPFSTHAELLTLFGRWPKKDVYKILWITTKEQSSLFYIANPFCFVHGWVVLAESSSPARYGTGTMALRPTPFVTSTRLAALFATTVMSATGAVAATKAAVHKNKLPVHETKPKKLAPQIQQDPEEIKVSADRPLAGGLMKRQHAPEATNSISALAIQQRGAASSPLQIAASLPGVNFGSSDAYGLSVRNNISVRGLDSTEMGWAIEGAPGVDQAYYWPYTETWADNENISDITLIAGTSRINDPVQTASGGEMIETVRDPSRKRGAYVDYSYGSFRGQRVFGRVDSGEIGHSGIRLFASYSRTAADNFTGPGRNTRDHVDFKAIKEWSDRAKSSLFISYSNWDNARLAPYTLSSWEKANKARDNFSQYTYAGNYTPGVTSNYWKSYVYKRTNVLLSWQNEITLTDKVRLHVVPYFHWSLVDSPGQTSIQSNSFYYGNEKVDPGLSSATTPAMIHSNQTEFATGVNAYIQYDPTRHNHLIAGYWYDHWNIEQSGGLTPLDANGNSPNATGKYVLRSPSGNIYGGTHYQESSQVNEFYVSDTQGFLNDKIKATIGLKTMMYYLSGTNQIPGGPYHFSSAFVQPMPRLSLSWQINKALQVYINGTTNTRAPVPISTYPTTYSVSTGKVSQAGNTNAKPEYSIGEEIGLRYYGAVHFDMALFNMNLTNHQLVALTYLNGAPVQQAISAGGETIRGITAELATKPFHGFSPYINGQYLHTTIDNNLAVNGDLLPTAGKTMVASPKFMANIGVNYTHGPFFANIAFKWVDSQYSTFMNDQSMQAYKTVDLGLGYRLPRFSVFSRPTLRLNLSNLTNVSYLSSIASIQTNSKATKGIYGTTIAASTPSYYLAAPFSAMVTIGSEF